MISTNEAWDLIKKTVSPMPKSSVSLNDALHHVLAEPVSADRDLPAADRSAMDGFAVRAADVSEPGAVLRVAGEVAAGSAAAPEINSGECVLIYTGANLPPDADTIVRVENTAPTGETSITVIKPVKEGSDIFRAGENARKGERIIPAGVQLSPAHIGLCAQVGLAAPRVFRQPAISLLTTGAELKSVRDSIEDHQIRDSNGPTLSAMLKANHFSTDSSNIIDDDLNTTSGAITALLEISDFIIITGGVSVGNYDYVPEAITKAGGTIVFHGVAMQPGKPQLFASFPDEKYAFGLPGNPLSVMTGFHEFILPALKLLSGMPAAKCRERLTLPLSAEVSSKGKREYYALARLTQNESGYAIEPVKRAGSADLVAAGMSDGTFTIPLGTTHLDAGALVKFTPWTAI